MYSNDFHIVRYNIDIQLVQEEDVEFVYSLRSNKNLTRFINHFEGSVEDQLKWIREYKKRQESGFEYYFIFRYKGKRQGLARIYKIEKDHFTQGSWIFSPDSITGCSILGNIISCELGFELPDKKYMYTDARKGNNTHRFVQKFNPTIVKETNEDIFYKISKEDYYLKKEAIINTAMQVLEFQ